MGKDKTRRKQGDLELSFKNREGLLYQRESFHCFASIDSDGNSADILIVLYEMSFISSGCI